MVKAYFLIDTLCNRFSTARRVAFPYCTKEYIIVFVLMNVDITGEIGKTLVRDETLMLLYNTYCLLMLEKRIRDRDFSLTTFIGYFILLYLQVFFFKYKIKTFAGVT